MPHNTTSRTPNSSSSKSPGNDQPAIWLLNARIPYTAQYHACSCWASGCGEVDVFEVLSPGGDKATTTVRASYAGGDPNYFARPVDVGKPARVAVVFDGAKGEVSVQVLGATSQGEFPEVLGGGPDGGGKGVEVRGGWGWEG